MDKSKIIVSFFVFVLFSFSLLYCMDPTCETFILELQTRAYSRARSAAAAISARSVSHDALPNNHGVALPSKLLRAQSRSHDSLPMAGSPPIMFSSNNRAADLRDKSKKLVQEAGFRNSIDDSAGNSFKKEKKLLEMAKEKRHAADDKAGSIEMKHRPLGADLDSITPESTPPRIADLRRKEKKPAAYRKSLLSANASALSRELAIFYGTPLAHEEVVQVENELLVAVVRQMCMQPDECHEAAAKLRVVIQANSKREQSPFKRPQAAVLKLLFACQDPLISRLSSIFTRQLDAEKALAFLILLENSTASDFDAN
jgi:hypothetical protein